MEETITNQTFEAFLSRWLISQEHHLHDLLQLIESGDEQNEQMCNNLISDNIAHYKQYLQAKKTLVRQNVFLVLAPTWISSFERAHFWIGGFRPRLAFRIVINNVLDLTKDQTQTIKRVMAEIKEEEDQLTHEFDKVQERMISSSILELTRQMGRPPRNGASDRNMETAVDMLKLSIEALVECADFLRRKSCGKIIEILNPTQCVRFLAAAAQLQVNLRRLGMERDGNRLHSA
ncbi:hypothetical protein ACP275_06G140500 [Erythranthe tilingii]